MNESVDIMYDKRLFSKEDIRNVNYKEEKNWRDSLLISMVTTKVTIWYIGKENPNQRPIYVLVQLGSMTIISKLCFLCHKLIEIYNVHIMLRCFHLFILKIESVSLKIY